MKRLFSGAAAVVAVAVMAAAPLQAQDIKASLLNDFERQRANVLGMVEAMPEAGLRTAPTEGVRDFAQQIEHVVQGNVSIVQSGYDRAVDIPELDAEVYLNSKAELKSMVNTGFDLLAEMIGSMSQDDLMAETSLFGQATVQKWQLVKTAYEHAVWTLGATVPYVRSQGGTPPGYGLVPSS